MGWWNFNSHEVSRLLVNKSLVVITLAARNVYHVAMPTIQFVDMTDLWLMIIYYNAHKHNGGGTAEPHNHTKNGLIEVRAWTSSQIQSLCGM